MFSAHLSQYLLELPAHLCFHHPSSCHCFYFASCGLLVSLHPSQTPPNPTPPHPILLSLHRAARLIWFLHKSDPVISLLNMIFTLTPNSSMPPERLCLSGSVLPCQPLLELLSLFSKLHLSDSKAPCAPLDPRAFAHAVSVCLANSHQPFGSPPQHPFLRPALQVIPA